MIGRSDEYAKMFDLEGKLWWYRHLHERVETALQQQFGNRRDIHILDAGCGTGGMLSFLQKRHYAHLRGIDGSADAVAFCHERGLDVSLVNLHNMALFEPETQYDVIICNDVFCYFMDPELLSLLTALTHRLKPGGVLITNNNAFSVFRGQHDLAVAAIRRFIVADFAPLLPRAGLQIGHATYWSLLLSPLILAMRQWQRLELAMGWQAAETAKSDVYLPSPWLNETLYQTVRTEQKLLARTPFGSSLFMTLKKSL